MKPTKNKYYEQTGKQIMSICLLFVVENMRNVSCREKKQTMPDSKQYNVLKYIEEYISFKAALRDLNRLS